MIPPRGIEKGCYNSHRKAFFEIFGNIFSILEPFRQPYRLIRSGCNARHPERQQRGGILSYWKLEGASSQKLLAFHNAS
jgi:hypothetical protein